MPPVNEENRVSSNVLPHCKLCILNMVVFFLVLKFALKLKME